MSVASMHRKLGRPATLADLATLPPGQKGEVLDGELYVQARPTARHSRVTGAIVAATSGPYNLGQRGAGCWWLLREPGIALPGSQEFSPDMAGWRSERLPELPANEAIRVAPDWACEVMSPTTRGYDLVKKRPFYARIGVSWLWYVDVEARSISVSQLRDGAWVELAVHGDDERVRLQPFPDVEQDLSLWWLTRAER
jgi:Uma2 family endonuclease